MTEIRQVNNGFPVLDTITTPSICYFLHDLSFGTLIAVHLIARPYQMPSENVDSVTMRLRQRHEHSRILETGAGSRGRT